MNPLRSRYASLFALAVIALCAGCSTAPTGVRSLANDSATSVGGTFVSAENFRCTELELKLNGFDIATELAVERGDRLSSFDLSNTKYRTSGYTHTTLPDNVVGLPALFIDRWRTPIGDVFKDSTIYILIRPNGELLSESTPLLVDLSALTWGGKTRFLLAANCAPAAGRLFALEE